MSVIKVSYKPTFIRRFNKLELALQEEILEKIELLKNSKNHKALKVHKLKGRLNNRHSFSVNYKVRIIFSYENRQEIVLLAAGDHDMYK